MSQVIYYLYLIFIEMRRANKTLDAILKVINPPSRTVNKIVWHVSTPLPEE